MLKTKVGNFIVLHAKFRCLISTSGHWQTLGNFSATGSSTLIRFPAASPTLPPLFCPRLSLRQPFDSKILFPLHNTILNFPPQFCPQPTVFFTDCANFPVLQTQLLCVSGLNRAQHSGSGFNKNIQVRLENEDLWVKFNEIGTEMIITKTGR